MKVFIILTVLVVISRAHHTKEHRSVDEDLPEDQETTDIPTGETDKPTPAETSRHHAPQASVPAQGIPVLVPYPAIRANPVYYHQPIQYVPVYQEYPSARQGIGGGLQANLGPLNAGVGAGVGTGGLGGGFNLGLGSLGGINANAGFTPTVVLSNNPGYTRYYNRYYTQPTKYYTTKPTRYVSVESTATPAEYPIHQLASSSPAVSTPFARSQSRDLLIPMYG